MPNDIRSYFTTLGGKQKKENVEVKEINKKLSKGHANIEEDEDVIPESPQYQQKDKKKKRTRYLSSSDEEETNNSKSKNIKTNDKQKAKEITSNNKKTSSVNKKSPAKPELKKCNPMDFFGKGPVKRVIESNEKSESIANSKKIKTELGVHDDENFNKTLLDLDNDNEAFKPCVKLEVKKQNGKKDDTVTKTGINNLKNGTVSEKPSKTISESAKAKDKSDNQRSPCKRSSPRTPQKSRDSSVSKNEADQRSSHTRSSSRTPQKPRDSSVSKNEADQRSSHTRSSSRTPQKSEKSNSSKKSSKIDVESDVRSIKTEKQYSSKSSPSKKVQNDMKISKSLSGLDKKLAISEKAHGKKDFSMFLNDEPSTSDSDVIILDDSISSTQNDKRSMGTPKSENKSKKRKALDTSVSELTDEERQERKRHSLILYKNYQNRSGPKHPGSKEVPEGAPNCLAGCAFLVTGVLDCFDKDEIEEIVIKFGGDFKKNMSGKVTHLIVGDEAGPSKLAQAEKFGTTLLSEDEFLELIKDNTKNKSSKHVDVKKEKSADKKKVKTPSKGKSPKKRDTKEEKDVKLKREVKEEVESPFFQNGVKTEETKMDDVKVSQPTKTDSGSSVISLSACSGGDVPWVEKYKPQTLKQIIGQRGENSNVNKLLKWLSEWYANRKKSHPKPNPWAGDKQGGGYYKAALLSGPPGVGKTTTVGLVCKELGFDTVEFNASDTRSKTLLKEHLSDLVSSNSLSGFYHGKSGKGAISKKHVVVMDEVDGMAGNEDRGGMQELLSLIKTTSVPIICMCNDKTSPKMRSLSSNCYDLTFSRPKVDQIKGAMLSVCYKEGVKIPPSALAQMITAANQDVRQVLNLLSVWSAADKNLSSESVQKDSDRAHKDLKLGPWEVVRKVFSHEEHKKMSIHDKSDLFFNDYSLGPLFVQQNYLKVTPKCDKKEILSRFAEAADCLSIGDMVESKIRSNMAWSLLPLQAMFSSVIPGDLLAGHMSGQIEFPSWLGQNSRTNKMNRLAQELHSHTSLSTSGSKLAIRLDYANHLRDAVIDPLIRKGSDGVHDSLNILQDYHLLREDLDSLLEMTHWTGQRDPYSMVETKVKAALTRTYNKEAAPLPYSQISMKKSKSTVNSEDSSAFSSEPSTQDTVEDEDNEEDSDVEHDVMIKAKVSKATKSNNSKKGSSSEKPSTSKESNNSKGKRKK